MEIITEMTIGKYKGQPLGTVPTDYLLWLVSRESIRYNRQLLTEAVLRELRGRFEHWETLLADMRVDAPPPEYWKTSKRAQQKKAEQAEKLRRLEERRRQAFQEETRKRLAWTLARRYQIPSGTMTAEQILEAFEMGALPGQKPRKTAGRADTETEFPDLV